MDNEGMVFGGLGKIRAEDIKGAELSYMPFKKADLVEMLSGYPSITGKQAQEIWTWYSDKCGKIYDRARVNNAPITPDVLRQMDFSRDGFEAFAHSIGISHDDIVGIYGEHEVMAEQAGEQMAERQEAARAEAEAQADAGKDNNSSASPTHVGKEEAKAMVDSVINNPKDVYWTGTQDQRDRRIAFVNRLREIAAGLKNDLAGYVEDMHQEKEQIAKEQYGIADSDSLYQSGSKNSSNGISTDQSWKNGEDTGKDDIAAGAEGGADNDDA